MSRKKSNGLPSKAKMLSIVIACFAGYALLESIGGFDFSAMAEPTRKVLGRAGIVVGYLSALVAGLSFYWDTKAQEIVKRAESIKREKEEDIALLQKLSAELGRRFNTESAQSMQHVAEADADLLEASQYLSSKNWLGWLALSGVVLGTILQLISAT